VTSQNNKITEFWITNITKLDVMLGDLRLSVPNRTHMNLLDSKHFHYSLAQLQESEKSGSLYKKSDKIKVRKVRPEILVEPGLYVSEAPLYMTEHPELSQVIIEHVDYEELHVGSGLKISDEEFANQLTEDDET